MRKLDCIIELGKARIGNAVDFTIWKYTAHEFMGRGGYVVNMMYRPIYPERCENCDCDPINQGK